MNAAALTLAHFVVLREGAPLFREVNATARPGDVLRLVGRNGVGKSTLLKLLAGIQIPGMATSGVCSALSFAEPGRAVERSRGGVMLVRQTPTSYRGLSAAEQVVVASEPPRDVLSAVWAALRGRGGATVDRRHVDRALDDFGLATCAGRRMAELSVGQRRAVCLAAARVRLELGRLRLLLLDEPQSGLDVERKSALGGLISDAAAAGCCVIIAEHLSDGENERGSVLRLEPNGEVPE